MSKYGVAVVIVGLLMANGAHASVNDKDKQTARSLFEEGVVHCTKALEHSRSDQQVSQQEYEAYSHALSRAEAIYPGIIDDSAKTARQVKQCEQIGDDIARYQALPLLDQGVLACNAAKQLAKGDYLSKARTKYREYVNMRDKALSLTPSVLKVASNSSKVRRCDKLEGNLMAAQDRIEKEEVDANALITLLSRANESCQVAQHMAVKSGVSRSKLDATKAMVSVGENYFREASIHKGALQRAKNYPGYQSSKAITELSAQFTACNNEIAVVLKTAGRAIARLEDNNKLKQQQKLAKAVEEAVEEAKRATIATLTSEAEKVVTAEKEVTPEYLLEMEAVVAANAQESVSTESKSAIAGASDTSQGASDASSPLADKKVSKKARTGKGGSKGGRTEVVQVSAPW